MNIVDKLILALLVIMLPIGFLVSYKILAEGDLPGKETSIDAKKLKQMVDRYSQLEEYTMPKQKFVVSSVSYASESGFLSVTGVAPSSQATIMMSATVLPHNDSEKELVLGNSIDAFAVSPKNTGAFEFVYPVDISSSVVEIRLEQEEVVRTIRFDLEKKVQLL
ncbi:hypothetical protein ACFL1M_04235 [Patescibacteria group bacterium]